MGAHAPCAVHTVTQRSVLLSLCSVCALQGGGFRDKSSQIHGGKFRCGGSRGNRWILCAGTNGPQEKLAAPRHAVACFNRWCLFVWQISQSLPEALWCVGLRKVGGAEPQVPLAEAAGFRVGNFAAILKCEISHTNRTAPETPPPLQSLCGFVCHFLLFLQ